MRKRYNQEKALKGAYSAQRSPAGGQCVRDYEPSCGPPFEALPSNLDAVETDSNQGPQHQEERQVDQGEVNVGMETVGRMGMGWRRWRRKWRRIVSRIGLLLPNVIHRISVSSDLVLLYKILDGILDPDVMLPYDISICIL